MTAWYLGERGGMRLGRMRSWACQGHSASGRQHSAASLGVECVYRGHSRRGRSAGFGYAREGGTQRRALASCRGG